MLRCTIYQLLYSKMFFGPSDSDPIINWKNIIWVNRSTPLYIIQYVVALISLSETCLLTYVGYKVSLSREAV